MRAFFDLESHCYRLKLDGVTCLFTLYIFTKLKVIPKANKPTIWCPSFDSWYRWSRDIFELSLQDVVSNQKTEVIEEYNSIDLGPNRIPV